MHTRALCVLLRYTRRGYGCGAFIIADAKMSVSHICMSHTSVISCRCCLGEFVDEGMDALMDEFVNESCCTDDVHICFIICRRAAARVSSLMSL